MVEHSDRSFFFCDSPRRALRRANPKECPGAKPRTIRMSTDPGKLSKSNRIWICNRVGSFEPGSDFDESSNSGTLRSVISIEHDPLFMEEEPALTFILLSSSDCYSFHTQCHDHCPERSTRTFAVSSQLGP
ncbi:unnamed protein product [Periconia digitata]|uniref:Uncharacterized protein n=1 Tax=Periconia digitata TaxID=1303443 RepID=A0A9W4UBB9_9PLEO|nr:unnamed protein product [Periconia digitata]